MQAEEITEKSSINAGVTAAQNVFLEGHLLLLATVKVAVVYREMLQKKEGRPTGIQKAGCIVSGQESSSVVAMTVKDRKRKWAYGLHIKYAHAE